MEGVITPNSEMSSKMKGGRRGFTAAALKISDGYFNRNCVLKAVLQSKPDFLFIMGFTLNPRIAWNKIYIEGYDLFRKDAVGDGRGILVYYLKELEVSSCPELETETSTEAVWLLCAHPEPLQLGGGRGEGDPQTREKLLSIVGTVGRMDNVVDYLTKCVRIARTNYPHAQIIIPKEDHWAEILNDQFDEERRLFLYKKYSSQQPEPSLVREKYENGWILDKISLTFERCPSCLIVFVSHDDLSRHRTSAMHRKNYCFDIYQRRREYLLKDKVQLNFEPEILNEKDFQELKYINNEIIEISTMSNVEVELHISIVNNGNDSVVIRAIDFLKNDATFYLEDQYNLNLPPEDRKEGVRGGVRLPPTRRYGINVRASNSEVGHYLIPLAIQVSDKDENLFHIAKEIYLRVENEDIAELKPTSPYTKPKRVEDPQPNELLQIKGPKCLTGTPSNLERVLILDKYEIPRVIGNLLKKGFNPSVHMSESERKIYQEYKAYLTEGLTTLNFTKRFQFLLHCEEFQMKIDIRQYDMQGEEMTRDRTKNYLRLVVPGLAENRPSILKGDALYVQIVHASGMVENQEYEGYVYVVEETAVLLKFGRDLHERYLPGMKFNVRFTFNRYPLRNMHRSVCLISEFGLLNRVFPADQQGSRLESPPSSRLVLFNRDIERNAEQKRAVVNILKRTSGSAPYIIFGPPGTGKTVTMVESILQVNAADKNRHILVCAPSNSATDLLASRLLGVKPKSTILRVNAAHRQVQQIPTDIREISSIKGDEVIIPKKAVIMTFEIVCATLCTAGRLVSANFPPNHFSHVFIDEAGHATEPELLIPIAGILREMSSSQIILAGDPKQLGPVIRSPIALHYGLQTSFLERLMSANRLYQPKINIYDASFITKLLRSFRSHENILRIPSRLFYNDELIAAADPVVVSSLIGWEELPNPKFPIIFHGVKGKDQREARSPSFFNPEEVIQVVKYVELLLDSRKRILPREIGIISPYRRQVQKINQLLQKKFSRNRRDWTEISVGSTEEFQGQERRIIIISTVRSQPCFLQMDYQHKIGFLKDPKRFNVAVTRAKALLIIVGNPELLSYDKDWATYLKYIYEKGGYRGIQFSPSESVSEDVDAIERKFRFLDLVITEENLNDVSEQERQEGQAWRADH